MRHTACTIQQTSYSLWHTGSSIWHIRYSRSATVPLWHIVECPNAHDCWTVGLIDCRDRPTPGSRNLAQHCITFLESFLCMFVDIVLGPPFFRFWCQLGPNLPPNLGPKSSKNRSKSPPRSIQNRILFLITFCKDFWSIFGRFSTPKSIKNRSKIDQEINPTTQQPK